MRGFALFHELNLGIGLGLTVEQSPELANIFGPFFERALAREKKGRAPRGRRAGTWLKNNNANSTQCSQAVTQLSTDCARSCLSAVIGREPECSAWCGR